MNPRERHVWLGAGVAALVVALVAGIGIVTSGFDRSEQHLSDASVWVANTATGQLGRANTSISAIDTAVKLEGDPGVIAQDKERVVMHSTQKNTLTVLDPAQAEALGTVNLPEGDPQVVTSGSRLGILDPEQGDFWVRSLSDVADYDPSSEPDGQVGSEAQVTVGSDGVWAGFSRTSSRVTVGGTGSEPSVVDVDFSGRTDSVQVSLVGEDPVVYDEDTNELFAFGEVTDLSGVVTEADSVRLAQPVAEQDRVLLAHDGGLLSVGRGEDSVELPVDGMDSTPAAPVRSDGCWYGAWAEGRGVQYCDDRDPEAFDLEDSDGNQDLTLRVNSGTLVADDAEAGKAWALQRGGSLISNWDDFSDEAQSVQHHRDDVDVPPTPEKTQKAPRAQDDEFGARPGRANVLPVLLNDSDPNGDALLVSSVQPPPATKGTVQIVENGQKVQLTPRPDAEGTVTFSYTVDDGHGGQDRARVKVELVGEDVNHAPVQRRSSRTTVVQDGHVGMNALDDWVDPESDPIYLERATVDAPDQVGAEASGRLDLTHGGGDPGVDTVKTVVSDGKAKGTGRVNVTVQAKGKTPIITENTTLTGRLGTESSIAPAELARGGSAELRLTRAEVTRGEKDGLDASVLYSDGSVRLTPEEPGDYEVTYAVSDGDDSATGVIRVVVDPESEGSKDPVVSPTTAFVRMKDSTEAEILDHAYDPSGEVLTVTDVSAPESGSGIRTEIVDGQKVKATLGRQLEDPVTLKVTVSNGTSSSTGDLTLVQIPEPSRLQAPVARDDTATVRAGEVVDIPVLDNDTHPDGKPLRLSRTLQSKPDQGLMVTDSQRLRYLAPDEPGTYTARYTVKGPDGREAVGQVEVIVTELDAAENRAPSAPTVQARTRSGSPVTIPVPTTGADPDGDAATVSAVVSPPEHGTITEVAENRIVYVPNEHSAGTDTFSYRLTDPLGAGSTGKVRVGVQDAADEAATPSAQDDLVTTRPGSHLHLDVTDNDTDPLGNGLNIASVTTLSGGMEQDATTDGKNIDLTLPEHDDSVTVLYRVEDAEGRSSTAWLTVDVREDAPAVPPTTQDRTLSLTDVSGRDQVPVDVLKDTDFTEGSRSDLAVRLPQGWSEADVDAQSRVVVPVGKERSIVPFTVYRKDDKKAASTSFITIPGTDEAAPERRKNAPELTVKAGESLDIDLSGQVIAAGGRSVVVAKTNAVSGMNGSVSVKDTHTLSFEPESGYWGPAAVSVPVTDGRTEATVLLPITVEPQRNPAPKLRSATVSVESAETTTLDLRSITDLGGTEAAEAYEGLTFTAAQGDTSVAEARVKGPRLQVRAADHAKVDSGTRVTVTATDEQGRKSSAPVDITVTASSKPPPLAHDDSVNVRRGKQARVDVTANDVSPFKNRDLDLVDVTTATAVKGVHVSRSGSGIQVSADQDSQTGTASVVYTIQDATGDPRRRAEGVLTVTVQDVPGAPGTPGVVEHPERAAVTLSAAGAEPNGSAIRYYEYRNGGEHSAVRRCDQGPRGCEVAGLDYGDDHSFRMRAVNGLGAGEWSPPSRRVMMDKKPGKPRQVKVTPSGKDRSGHTLRVAWKAPSPAPWGSDLEGYTVRVTGPGLPDGGKATRVAKASTTVKDSRIRAGERYTVAVTAQNRRMTSASASDAAVAVAAPRITEAQAGIIGDGSRAQVSVSADPRGGTAQIRVGTRRKGDEAGTCSTAGFRPNVDGTTWTTSLKKGTDPRYVVRVSNGLFCTRAVTSEVDTHVSRPEGSTDTVEDTHGPEQGAQPRYRVDPGSQAAKYYFVHVGKHKPSATGSGWKRTQPGRRIDFGTTDARRGVWAMNCRTSDRAFCSGVTKLGTETKRSVDLSVKVRDDGDECVADGESMVRLKARPGVRIEARWRDRNDDPVGSSGFEEVEDRRVEVPERDLDEKVSLWLRSSKHGFTHTPDSAAVTCVGPEEDDHDSDPSPDGEDHENTEPRP